MKYFRDFRQTLHEAETKEKDELRPKIPMMLMFRRKSVRPYPDNQVVALYYNQQLDKFLSIPFGPGENLNLSEEIEEDEDVVLETFQEKLQRLREETDQEERQRLGVKDNYGWKEKVPGYVDQKKASAKWQKGDKWGAIKSGAKSVGKKALTGLAILAGGKAIGAAAGAVGAYAGSTAANALSKSSGPALDHPTRFDPKKGNTRKLKSGLENRKPTDSVTQTKLKQAALAKPPPIKENSVFDLRKMVEENVPTMELTINDRSITISRNMAKSILETYDSVNKENKKRISKMLNESVEDFKRLLDFSLKEKTNG